MSMKKEWIAAIIFLAVAFFEKFSGFIPSIWLHLLFLISFIFIN